MKIGLGLGIGSGVPRPPQIITGTGPVIAALADGDTLSGAVTWGSYVSSAGNITDPTTKQMSVDGGAFITYDGATVVAASDSYVLLETVADDAGTTPRPFLSNTVQVPGLAPSITASDGLAGRVYTVTIDSVTGTGPVSTELLQITFDGVEQLDEPTVGAGPFSFEIADSFTDVEIIASVRAYSAFGQDIATVTETVAANLIAPSATGTISNQTYPEGEVITPLDTAVNFLGTDNVYSLDGTSAALPAGLSLSSVGLITGTPTTEATAVTIVILATNAGGTATQSFTITISAAAGGDVTAPQIISFSVGPQNVSTFDVPMDVEVTNDDSLPIVLHYVGVTAGAAAPSAAQIRLGDDAADADAPIAGSQSFSTADTFNIALPEGLFGNYDFYATVRDSATSPNLWTGTASDLNIAVDAASGFTESAVDVASTVYLVAPTTLGTDKKSALAFFSYTSSQDARAVLFEWNNSNGGFRAEQTGSNTAVGLRWYLQDTVGTTITASDEVHALGTRLHYLASWWIDEGATTTRLRIYRKVGGTWTSVAADNVGYTGTPTLDLGSIAPALFAKPDGSSPYDGIIHAVRVWTSTSAAAIADITSSTVQDYFVNGDAVEDPATATGVLGTALVDFTGPASEYTAGTHDGSMGSFTKTGAGSFTDV